MLNYNQYFNIKIILKIHYNYNVVICFKYNTNFMKFKKNFMLKNLKLLSVSFKVI